MPDGGLLSVMEPVLLSLQTGSVSKQLKEKASSRPGKVKRSHE